MNNWTPEGAEGAQVVDACLRKAHLELIGFFLAGHANFCYKYCALMIDVADGEGTDEAKQMHFQLWSQKAGGKEEERARVMSGLE